MALQGETFSIILELQLKHVYDSSKINILSQADVNKTNKVSLLSGGNLDKVYVSFMVFLSMVSGIPVSTEVINIPDDNHNVTAKYNLF